MRQPKQRFMSTCTACGKLTYRNKKQAKEAARNIDPAMKPYAGCNGGYHIGHLRLGSRDAYRK